MRWSFTKYVGCGNDFILFDNREGTFPISPSIIQNLCHRQQGIGGDGLILLEKSSRADFRMRIFNSNGTEPEMCGNGLRCLVKWVSERGFQKQTCNIEIMHRVLSALIVKDAICIEMGTPTDIQWDIPLQIEKQLIYVHHLDTGVPHTLFFVNDIDNVNVFELGTYIRNHPLWAPKGTNVTFVQQKGFQTLKIRTFERGVEGETLACGTGAAAAALAGAYQYKLSSPLTIQTLSGENLTIGFSLQENHFSQVTMTGRAQWTFQGEVDL